MRAKDARTADCIRMIKTKHMERRTAAGFKGPLDDSLWLDVIAAYQKQLRKSREEYVAIGERGAEAMEQIDFEIGFCSQFLPKAASDDETRSIVRETVARLGVSDAKQAGRVVGEIMKANKGKVEPATVKRMVEEELGAPKGSRRRAAQSGAGSRSSGGAPEGAGRPRRRARTGCSSWAMGGQPRLDGGSRAAISGSAA